MQTVSLNFIALHSWSRQEKEEIKRRKEYCTAPLHKSSVNFHRKYPSQRGKTEFGPYRTCVVSNQWSNVPVTYLWSIIFKLFIIEYLSYIYERRIKSNIKIFLSRYFDNRSRHNEKRHRYYEKRSRYDELIILLLREKIS